MSRMMKMYFVLETMRESIDICKSDHLKLLPETETETLKLVSFELEIHLSITCFNYVSFISWNANDSL